MVELEHFRVSVDDSRAPGEVRLLLHGELDVVSVAAMRQVLAAIEGAGRIILDLAGLTFIDSSGLGLVVRAYQERREAGGELVVTGATGGVESVFGVSGLDRIVSELPPT